MKAKVIETGEIVNVTSNPTWYKENGQGPDRRECDEDELEFIYSNKKEEKFDLERAIDKWICDAAITYEDCSITDVISTAKHFFELGIKLQKGK